MMCTYMRSAHGGRQQELLHLRPHGAPRSAHHREKQQRHAHLPGERGTHDRSPRAIVRLWAGLAVIFEVPRNLYPLVMCCFVMSCRIL